MEIKAKRKPRSWTFGLAIWFIVSVLASLPAWGAIYVNRNWNDNSLFEMANHSQWHFAVAMICVLVLDLVLRWWHQWRAPLFSRLLHAAILLTPTVYLCSVAEPWTALPLAGIVQTNKPKRTLSIASWNVFIQNDQYETIKKTIESLDADVLLLIEVTPEHRKGLESLSKSYPYSLWAPRNNTQGLAILSRVPGTRSRELSIGPSQMLALEIRIPAGENIDVPISILGVHTASPNEQGRFRVRDQQLADIANWVKQSPGESIVLGDMNITPWSVAFKELRSSTGLVDSRRYRGYYATWPCGLGIVGIPIDHGLVSRGLKIIDRECGFPTIDSDHQWIRMTIDGTKVDRSPQVSLDGNGKSSKDL
jgi:endonuclease/exonuclease/phosphatase (EEP) superfamily protein YafD